jgi:hypothetical protein
MSDASLAEYALIELWWVIVLLGLPALIAVLWEKHSQVKARKNAQQAIQKAAEQGLIERRSNVLPFIPTQRSKDDHIFDVVQEYRNDAN